MLDLSDCRFTGPALPLPFLQSPDAPRAAIGLDGAWDSLRARLRATRGRMAVTMPVLQALGYDRPKRQTSVLTRDGREDGGWLATSSSGASLRVWTPKSDVPFEHSGRDGIRASALRVLAASGESTGLLLNGSALLLLLSDQARIDSFVLVDLSLWRDAPVLPDSLRLLSGLMSAAALPRLPEILETARLHQARTTKSLRHQAKAAICGFINALPDRSGLDAGALWHQTLILVYRLLFILKLESAPAEDVTFSFAATSLWRSTLSPNRALAPLVRRNLDQRHETGHMLESGLRLLFTAFQDGLTCPELCITPLGGALFSRNAMPVLESLSWGDRAVAVLLDNLIWTTTADEQRARVHYGSLGVEELGSIYETLLEQEPAIADEPMRYEQIGKATVAVPTTADTATITLGQFFLQGGDGRKASGAFYTPPEFVRFMVRQTLAPMIAELSPVDDPHPARLLAMKIVDPAMGSGHFLVEACRYMADALLDASRSADALGLQDRITALPDQDATLLAYLPSRGWSEDRAKAICRRMVAVHCLFGCDKNPLAVELAKVSLWLESYAEGLPLTFVDHRLVHGDALTGPFGAMLTTLPVTGGPLDPLLAAGVADRLTAAMAKGQHLVRDLGASIGRDLADIDGKERVKARLDSVLDPLRRLARAWAGAAMRRDKDADDIWLDLARYVAENGAWPARTPPGADALLDAGHDALPWDLTFPEAANGFSVVLGNPPWDVVLPNTTDFVARYHPRVKATKTQAQRATLQNSILADETVTTAFDRYRETFDRLKRVVPRLYPHQRVGSAAKASGGSLDLYRLFAERAHQLLAPDGAIGLLLPSSFHASEGAAGVRRLYLDQTAIECCLSFENRRRVFDIDSRFKFAIVIARRPGPTRTMQCGFYLNRIEDAARTIPYDRDLLERTGGKHLTPLELRSIDDLRVAERMFDHPARFGAWCANRHIQFGCDLHMTADAVCFQPAGHARLTLHEGKTFHQYTHQWTTAPRYSVDPAILRPALADAVTSERLCFRDIARATDDRTMIACMMPPGNVLGHTATVEKTPRTRSLDDALTLCAVLNSFSFDWLVRQKASTHLSLYMLDGLPMPSLSKADCRILADATRRLSRAKSPQLRAHVDAIVARAYGLSCDEYTHVLHSFGHRSWPDAIALCLDAYGRTD
jgi:hypothetical protein